MTNRVLKATGVVAGYRGVAVTEAIDLSVAAGEIVGILGRNGMGKSSLLGAIFGIVDRMAGTVEIDGRTLPARRPERLARAGASFLPEDRGVFPSLSVAQNLALVGGRDELAIGTTFPLLAERAKQPAGTLSGGQQQQLGIARAVAAGRRLVAVDELTHGLQPSMVAASFELLRRAADLGAGVLVVDQNPDLVAARCDRVVVMEAGRIVFEQDAGEGVAEAVTDLLLLR